MSLLRSIRSLFIEEKTSASSAKDRLQIILSHERAQRNQPDFLPALQKEIIQVIAKYTEINPDDVKVDFEQSGNHSVLGLNITLPETETETV